MSKKKKKKKAKPRPPKQHSPKNKHSKSASHPKLTVLPKSIREELYALYEQQVWEILQPYLKQLQREYPRAPDLYAMQTLVGYELQDESMVILGSYHWNRLLPDHPDALYFWGTTAFEIQHVGHALRALTNLVAWYPDHPDIDRCKKYLKFLEKHWEEFIQGTRLEGRKDAHQILCWKEDLKIALSSQNHKETLAIGYKILTRVPNDETVHNNLSIALFNLGRIEDAIQISRKVLASLDPKNIHALSNLIHYLEFAGETDEIPSLLDRLEACDAREDTWIKKFEAFGFCHAHERTLACFEQLSERYNSDASDASDDSEDPDASDASDSSDEITLMEKRLVTSLEDVPYIISIYRFVGVAYAHMGDEEAARTWLQKAHTLDPEPPHFKQLLHELSQEDGTPLWAFPLFNWLPYKMWEEALPFLAEFQENPSPTVLLTEQIDELKAYATRWPQLQQAAPLLLERGGPDAILLLSNLTLATRDERYVDILFEWSSTPQKPHGLRLEILEALFTEALITKDRLAARCLQQIEALLAQKELTQARRWRAFVNRHLHDHPVAATIKKKFGLWADLKRTFGGSKTKK